MNKPNLLVLVLILSAGYEAKKEHITVGHLFFHQLEVEYVVKSSADKTKMSFLLLT